MKTNRMRGLSVLLLMSAAPIFAAQPPAVMGDGSAAAPAALGWKDTAVNKIKDGAGAAWDCVTLEHAAYAGGLLVAQDILRGKLGDLAELGGVDTSEGGRWGYRRLFIKNRRPAQMATKDDLAAAIAKCATKEEVDALRAEHNRLADYVGVTGLGLMTAEELAAAKADLESQKMAEGDGMADHNAAIDAKIAALGSEVWDPELTLAAALSTGGGDGHECTGLDAEAVNGLINARGFVAQGVHDGLAARVQTLESRPAVSTDAFATADALTTVASNLTRNVDAVTALTGRVDAHDESIAANAATDQSVLAALQAIEEKVGVTASVVADGGDGAAAE